MKNLLWNDHIQNFETSWRRCISTRQEPIPKEGIRVQRLSSWSNLGPLRSPKDQLEPSSVNRPISELGWWPRWLNDSSSAAEKSIASSGDHSWLGNNLGTRRIMIWNSNFWIGRFTLTYFIDVEYKPLFILNWKFQFMHFALLVVSQPSRTDSIEISCIS